MDFSTLKVPELKERLKAMGLSTSGRKQTLIERLNLGNKTDNPDARGSNTDIEFRYSGIEVNTEFRY